MKIKETVPSAFIGVDIIVGFPGETDEDFMQSCTLMEELNPSFLHVFPYSERPGTPAIELPDKVKSAVKTERAAKLHQLSINLHHNFYQKNIGHTDEVLFESAKKKELMYGFSRNYVKVEYPYIKELIGKIVKVKMTGIAASGNMNVELI
jgi:threonylcarbamoyladenosine tRNA methylthiotransferase MtaB